MIAGIGIPEDVAAERFGAAVKVLNEGESVGCTFAQRSREPGPGGLSLTLPACA